MVHIVHLELATLEELLISPIQPFSLPSCRRGRCLVLWHICYGHRLMISDDLVAEVSLTGLLEDIRLAANLLRQGITRVETPHQTSTDIVLAVPFDLLARVTVEDQSNGELKLARARRGERTDSPCYSPTSCW